jgi:hypothetical protein
MCSRKNKTAGLKHPSGCMTTVVRRRKFDFTPLEICW